MVPRIRSLDVFPDSHSIVLHWEGGISSVKDMFDLIASRKIFAPLAEGAEFEAVRIAEDGRALEWPSGADYCADALWLETVKHADGSEQERQYA